MTSVNETDPLHVIQQLYQARRRYLRHAALFAFFIFGMALFLPAQNYWRETVRMTLPNTGDLLILGFVWAAIFAAHSATYWTHTREAQAYQRALAQGEHKAKRGEMRLADDGELADESAAEWNRDMRRRR
jgi:hypothetical protein